MTHTELARLVRQVAQLRKQLAQMRERLGGKVRVMRAERTRYQQIVRDLRAGVARLNSVPDGSQRDIPFAQWSAHLRQVHGVRLTTTTLRVLRSRGKGPRGHLVGGKLYSTAQHLAAWLVSRRAPSNTKHKG